VLNAARDHTSRRSSYPAPRDRGSANSETRKGASIDDDYSELRELISALP
jgi:hypothetical protein